MLTGAATHYHCGTVDEMAGKSVASNKQRASSISSHRKESNHSNKNFNQSIIQPSFQQQGGGRRAATSESGSDEDVVEHTPPLGQATLNRAMLGPESVSAERTNSSAVDGARPDKRALFNTEDDATPPKKIRVITSEISPADRMLLSKFVKNYFKGCKFPDAFISDEQCKVKVLNDLRTKVSVGLDLPQNDAFWAMAEQNYKKYICVALS